MAIPSSTLPACSQDLTARVCFADLGARRHEIERPGEGDEIRYTAFQLEADRAKPKQLLRAPEYGQGRHRSISPARKRAKLILDLIRNADVVVENFTPGVMALGLDAAALRGLFPDLVYC